MALGLKGIKYNFKECAGGGCKIDVKKIGQLSDLERPQFTDIREIQIFKRQYYLVKTTLCLLCQKKNQSKC